MVYNIFGNLSQQHKNERKNALFASNSYVYFLSVAEHFDPTYEFDKDEQ